MSASYPRKVKDAAINYPIEARFIHMVLRNNGLFDDSEFFSS